MRGCVYVLPCEGRPEEMHRVRQTRLRGKAAILERGERQEEIGFLIAARNAQLRDALRREPRDVPPFKQHPAGAHRQISRQQIDECGLPAPFGPMMAWTCPI